MSKRAIKPAPPNPNTNHGMLGASEAEQTAFLVGSGEGVTNPTTTGGGKKRRQKASDATDVAGADASEKPVVKKSRTNTPWTPEEEHRLKQMRDLGTSWSEIAKTFPNRTEGSVKKHWYKDMHYAEFGKEEAEALLAAIKEYDSSKWKVIGQKVGKPAKACEAYAKENFGDK